MVIPTIEELDNSLGLVLWKTLQIKAKENMYFRVMWVDMIIPEGFQSDGASIPKWLRVFINEYDPRWLFAAIVHDYLYRTQFMPRIIADNIFKIILKETAWLIFTYWFYHWVRVWWWYAWWKNSKNLQKYVKAKHDLKCYICNR